MAMKGPAGVEEHAEMRRKAYEEQLRMPKRSVPTRQACPPFAYFISLSRVAWRKTVDC
jgi:hypothetical protein